MKVYLAGPHMDDAYREEATRLLWELTDAPSLEVFDPIAARDFRGKEIEHEALIVEGDLLDVQTSNVILGNYSVPGWGTAMETWFAFSIHKPIVAYVAPDDRVSPWVAYVAGGYANVHRDLRAACAAVFEVAAW